MASILEDAAKMRAAIRHAQPLSDELGGLLIEIQRDVGELESLIGLNPRRSRRVLRQIHATLQRAIAALDRLD